MWKIGISAPSAGIWRHHQITKGTGEYFEPESHHPPRGTGQKAAVYLTYHHHTPTHLHHPLHPHQEQNSYHHFWMKLYELINFLHTKKSSSSSLRIFEDYNIFLPFLNLLCHVQKILIFLLQIYELSCILICHFRQSRSQTPPQHWSGNETVGQEHLVFVALFPGSPGTWICITGSIYIHTCTTSMFAFPSVGAWEQGYCISHLTQMEIYFLLLWNLSLIPRPSRHPVFDGSQKNLM